MRIILVTIILYGMLCGLVVIIDLYQKNCRVDTIACGVISRGGKVMLQEGDKSILLNVAKVIAVLVVVMFCLIVLASYIGNKF